MADDYCDLCDLPLSTCVHGMPPPEPPAPAPRRTPARASAVSGAPRVSRPRTVRPRPTPEPVRAVPARLTSAEALRPLIVSVLDDAGGHLEAEDVYVRLESRLEGSFLDRDLTTTPEGELRWRLAARKARQSLISDGTMVAGPGEWRLS